MNSFYTIGIVGHIDHGKTTLTKVLTGVDTDTLKEEKKRNITIEPGYAPWEVGMGNKIGIIDVPGHEKLIRQMIAGVYGIDLVIMVVAADDGVMPQTLEHLHLLELLGVSNGVIAITKCDKVEKKVIENVIEEIRHEFAGTFLSKADFIEISSVTGLGLKDIKSKILFELEMMDKKIVVSNLFRMPIDRVFTIPGVGTVVTGTIISGSVTLGETLEVHPKVKSVRVRGLQVFGEKRSTCTVGERVAINLAGVKSNLLHRGDVIVTPKELFETNRIDVLLDLTGKLRTKRSHITSTYKKNDREKESNSSLKKLTRIRFYSGAYEGIGKLVYYDRKQAFYGDRIICQIILDNPTIVCKGDRFVIRRLSPSEVLGGGVILDSLSEKHHFGEVNLSNITTKYLTDPKEELLNSIRSKGITTIEEFNLLTKKLVPDKSINELILEGSICLIKSTQVIESYIVCSAEINEWEKTIKSSLTEYHKSHPHLIGAPKVSILSRFPSLIRNLLKKHAIDQEWITEKDNMWALPTHEVCIPDSLKTKGEIILNQLKNEALNPSKLLDIGKSFGLSNSEAEILQSFLLNTENAYLFEATRLIDASITLKTYKCLHDTLGGDSFAIDAAKDSLKISRRNLILLLELWDQLGWTRREGNRRYWKKQK